MPERLLYPLARLGAATVRAVGPGTARTRLERAQTGTLDEDGMTALCAEADGLARLLDA